MSDIKATIQHIKPTIGGKFLFHCIPFRKSTVMENLEIAFGSRLSQTELEHLAKCFYSHLIRTIMENCAMTFWSQKRLKSRIRVEGIEHLWKASEAGKGILLLTGHFGNWEMGPIAGILHFQEFRGRLHVLRRQLVNKTIEKILFNRYYAVGLDVIPKRSSLSNVLAALENNDTVAFIMDQYARPGKEGIEALLFGKKAGTFKSLAVVKRASDAPLLPVVSYRDKDGSHVMRFSAPVEWLTDADPDTEILKNTEQYNRILEVFIEEHPDQWLWIHKRWKYKAPHVRKSKKAVNQ